MKENGVGPCRCGVQTLRMQENKGEMERAVKDVVMIGVKPEDESKELLTWVLVKMAKPGDTVIALHVIGKKEISSNGGQSTFFSLVKAFDSVLAVYEGFCNLKQVDLKLKICRGSSVKKILVREAKSNAVTKLVVGAVSQKHRNKPSTEVAKHCSKKLSKQCSVLAVNNGKVLFQKERCKSNVCDSQVTPENRPNSFLNVLLRSSTVGRNSHALNSKQKRNDVKQTIKSPRTMESFRLENVAEKDCATLSPPASSLCPLNPSGVKSVVNGCGAVSVPVDTVNSRSSRGISHETYDLKPGWPLLRNNALPGSSHSPRKKISVVQWAMTLPDRQLAEGNQNGLEVSSVKLSKLGRSNRSQAPIEGERDKKSSQDSHGLESLPEVLEGLHEKHSATCKLFSYQELVTATSNFSNDNLIGQGGSSQVYKGCLPDGGNIAVKMLKRSEESLKEFALEIEIITTLYHENVISLKGFGFEARNLFFVYDLLTRGSLEENLYGNKKISDSFGWDERYSVALGVAEALEYLHNGNSPSVIHRDVKSSNILLSDDFKPQLSDFGLATWAPTSASHITCVDVSGTFGYLAPEYFMYGKVNSKTDVYAFGVVLLELLSGRKPICNDLPKGKESLVMWAKPILNSGEFSQLLDPNLDSNPDPDRIEKMVLAAILCTKRSPRARPQMNLIVRLLKGDSEATQLATAQVSAADESDSSDDENLRPSNLQSHLNLALLGIEDDSLSTSSVEQNVSLEDYLKGRWSRSSSFD